MELVITLLVVVALIGLAVFLIQKARAATQAALVVYNEILQPYLACVRDSALEEAYRATSASYQRETPLERYLGAYQSRFAELGPVQRWDNMRSGQEKDLISGSAFFTYTLDLHFSKQVPRVVFYIDVKASPRRIHATFTKHSSRSMTPEVW